MNLSELPQWPTIQKISPLSSLNIIDIQTYQNDIQRFSIDAFGLNPTWQQHAFYLSLIQKGSRTSVKHSWGCQNSMIEAMAVIALWQLVCNPNSASLYLSSGRSHIRTVLMSKVEKLIKIMETGKLAELLKSLKLSNSPTDIYTDDRKRTFSIRQANKVTPISLAGDMAENFLFFAIDAAYIDEVHLEIGMSTLTNENSRAVLSQRMYVDVPDKGLFYESQHQQSHLNGGQWVVLTFSTPECPKVSAEELQNHIRYAGDGPDGSIYRTTVLGKYPKEHGG